MTNYFNYTLIQLLKFLYDLRQKKPAVSGREVHFTNSLSQWLSSLGFYCQVDCIGNLIVAKEKKKHYSLIIDAHIDEVGCVITGRDDKSFLRVEGNALANQLLDSDVVAIKPNGNTYYGICKSNVKNINENDLFKLYFTIKEKDNITAEPNDIFTWCNPLVFNDTNIIGHGLDNIIGVSVCLKLLFTKLKQKKDFAISLSVQEEIGFRGVTSILINYRPKEIIVVDCLSAVPKDKNMNLVGSRYGEGAVLVYGPGHNQYVEKIENQLINKQIKFSKYICFHPEPTNVAVVLPFLPDTNAVTLGYPIIEKHSKYEQVSSFDMEQLFKSLKILIYEI